MFDSCPISTLVEEDVMVEIRGNIKTRDTRRVERETDGLSAARPGICSRGDTHPLFLRGGRDRRRGTCLAHFIGPTPLALGVSLAAATCSTEAKCVLRGGMVPLDSALIPPAPES